MTGSAANALSNKKISVGEDTLEHLSQFYPAPLYDRKKIKAGILHMSLGGFHRSHEASYIDDYLNATSEDWMITAVGLMPQDDTNINALRSQDGLYSILQRSPNQDDVKIIGSIKNLIHGPSDPQAVFSAIADPAIKIISLTITEKGYYYNEKRNLDEQNPMIVHDKSLPDRPNTAYGYILRGLKNRRDSGAGPVTVMSCDNLPGNGHLTQHLIIQFAQMADPSMVDWIKQNVSFPNAMVDRITPVTTDEVRRILADDYNIDDKWPVVCEGYIQWVLEDNFAAGRPALETVGVQMVKEVEPYEKMKVRLLNGSHSVLSYISYLMGYRDVDAAMADPLIAKFVRGYMDNDITPTVPPVPGIDLDQYKTTLIQRFSNKSIRDQVQRLAEDGSQKFRNALVPALEHQLTNNGSTRYMAFALAAWYRYLLGIDEQNKPIEVKDPMRDRLMDKAKAAPADPIGLLAIDEIFGTTAISSNDFVQAVTKSLKDINDKGMRLAVSEFLGT